MKDRDTLNGEVRYAIRLCERTQRFYRRLQTAGTFLSVVGGSAFLSSAIPVVPSWVPWIGGIAVTVFGGALIAIRPADKAAANEADVRRYSRLQSDSHKMTDQEFEAALDKAKEGNAPEIEPMRKIAYNDVAEELGCPDAGYKLKWNEHILAALA